MPDATQEDKRYEVLMPFVINEIVADGENKLVFTCPIEYQDLPYADIVAIQGAMLNMLGELHSFGEAIAEEKGQGKKLEKMKAKKNKKEK